MVMKAALFRITSGVTHVKIMQKGIQCLLCCYKVVIVLFNMPLLVPYRYWSNPPHLRLSITRGIIVAAMFLPFPELISSIEISVNRLALELWSTVLYIVSVVV